MMLSILIHNSVKEGILMINQFTGLSWPQSFGVFLFCIGGVCPGFLILQMYRPELITELDILKLLLFCVSLCFPVVLANFILGTIAFENIDKVNSKINKAPEEKDVDHDLFGNKKHLEKFDQASFGFFMTAGVMYAALLICYSKGSSFSSLIALVVIFEVVLFLAVVGDYFGHLFKVKYLNPFLNRFKKKPI